MRVLVVFGGRSGEHEVSVLSARAVVEALVSLGHESTTAGITRAGRWVSCDPRKGDRVAEDAPPFDLAPHAGGRRDIDVVFPVVHGPHGEDGSLQGLFELADLPYIGAGVEGSVIGINKWLQKTLFEAAGLPVVRFVGVTRQAWEHDAASWVESISERVGYPSFAKPVRLGSSVGISKVHDAGELPAAVERALLHDDEVLIEAQGYARELEVGVLGEPPETSVVGEVVPDGEFYDYRAKYLGEWTELRIPADVPSSVAERVHDLAVEAFRGARCEGFARVDFFFDPANEDLILNEINTIPGVTPMSMFPRVWEASGRPFTEVVSILLDHAVTRHERKMKLESARAEAHDAEVGR